MIAREVRRTRRLDAFTVSVGDLKELCLRLESAVGAESGAYTSIEFELPNETVKLSAKSIDEAVRKCNAPRVTKFRVRAGKPGCFFVLSTDDLLGGRPVVYASSDSEAWCAGINEAAASYLRDRRAWYWWVHPWYVCWPLAFVTSATLTYALSRIWDTTWLPFVAGAATGLGVTFRDRVLPYGSVRLAPKRTNLVTTFTVIGAIAAVVAAIIALVQLFRG